MTTTEQVIGRTIEQAPEAFGRLDDKARLARLMPEMNQEKTRRAPLVVLIAYDLRFHEKLGRLMPYRDIKSWFTETRLSWNRPRVRAELCRGLT